MSHFKNILIALLVAYLVIDLCATYVTKLPHNGFVAVFMSLKNENRSRALQILGLGVAFGLVTFFAMRSFNCRCGSCTYCRKCDHKYTYLDNVSGMEDPGYFKSSY